MATEDYPNNNQKQYKYKIAFDQNSKGVVQFSGYIYFNDKEESDYEPTNISKHAELLSQMLSLAEHHFKQKGYKVASEAKEKEKN